MSLKRALLGFEREGRAAEALLRRCVATGAVPVSPGPSDDADDDDDVYDE